MDVGTARMNVKRITGMGAVATLALAMLVLGCVLVATAGPREALKSRTQALHQTLAAVPPLARAITVSTTWNEYMTAMGPEPNLIYMMESKAAASALAAVDGGTIRVVKGKYEVVAPYSLSDSDLSYLEGQFRGDFKGRVLRLASVSADWFGMTTAQQSVGSALSGTRGYAVDMELSYRLPYTGFVRVLAGSLSVRPAASSHVGSFFRTIDVAVTQQTARKFGLKVGSSVQTAGQGFPAGPGISFNVAAIVAERQPTSSFWEADPSLTAPELNVPGTSPPYWSSGAFALPDESDAVQQDFGSSIVNMQWVFPVSFGALQGDQAQALDEALQKTVTVVPTLTGPLAPVATAVTVSTGLQQPLVAFIDASAAVDVLLWLLYVSLVLIGVIVLLLAARMLVLRRSAELALRRSRGESLLQIGLAAGRGAAVGCIPAAVVAYAVSVLLVPGQGAPGGWWPALAVLVIAVGAPAVMAAWQQRLPRSGRGKAAGGYSRPGQTGRSQPSLGYGALGYARRGRRRVGVRMVVEVSAVLAAVAGIVVFRQPGSAQPGTSVNFYTSAAPALVAIPAVVVVLRLYPLVLRGLLRGAARGRGATSFLGLARAARLALTPALPAFALVLAVTVAAFAGMVRDAVTRGEVNASWQAAGADVAVSDVGPGGAIPPAAQRAFAAVPGVQHAAVVSAWLLTAPDGVSVTALAVNPLGYAAFVASSRTWPAVDHGALTGDGVLASPQALADFGGKNTVTLRYASGGIPVRVRVAGVLSGTPALAAGGAFVLMPDSLVAHEPFVVPNLVLLNGSGIDTPRLTALVNKMVPLATIVVRADLLATLTSAPTQRGAFLLFALALAVSAALGLAVMLLQLALGAADREATLARLATMGLGEGQRARLVLLEVIPAIIAAAIAAAASALVLPRIVAPALNLSVFTGSRASVPLVPDVASLALPIAGLVVVAALTLTVETRARRGVVATLRGGE